MIGTARGMRVGWPRVVQRTPLLRLDNPERLSKASLLPTPPPSETLPGEGTGIGWTGSYQILTSPELSRLQFTGAP